MYSHQTPEQNARGMYSQRLKDHGRERERESLHRRLQDGGIEERLNAAIGLGESKNFDAIFRYQHVPQEVCDAALIKAVTSSDTHFEAIKSLLKHGASPNARNEKGMGLDDLLGQVDEVRVANSTEALSAYRSKATLIKPLLQKARGNKEQNNWAAVVTSKRSAKGDALADDWEKVEGDWVEVDMEPLEKGWTEATSIPSKGREAAKESSLKINWTEVGSIPGERPAFPGR